MQSKQPKRKNHFSYNINLKGVSSSPIKGVIEESDLVIHGTINDESMTLYLTAFSKIEKEAVWEIFDRENFNPESIIKNNIEFSLS